MERLVDGMSFEDYIRFIKHMSIEEYNQIPWESKLQIEQEYDMTYGCC